MARDAEGDVAGRAAGSSATIAIIIFSLFIGGVITLSTSFCRAFWCAGSRRSSGAERVEHRWYAIQTTAGHENKVRSLMQRKIEQDPRPPEERPIRKALVPTQEVVEIKNGKKVTVERKLYPGYVLVEMVLNQETSHIINSIQGVIKFVQHGPGGPRKEPMALRR